jgi:hypothetical protein
MTSLIIYSSPAAGNAPVAPPPKPLPPRRKRPHPSCPSYARAAWFPPPARIPTIRRLAYAPE